MAFKTYSIRNYFWFAASTGLMLMSPLFVLLIINQLHLTLAAGEFALAYSISAPIQAFFGLNIRTFLAMNRLGEYSIEEIYAQRIHAAMYLSVILLVFVWIRHSDFNEIAVFLSMALVRFFESVTEVDAGILQRYRRPDAIAVIYGMRLVVPLPVFAFVLSLTGALPLALTALGLSQGLVWLVVDVPALKRQGVLLERPKVIRAALSGRPIRLSFAFASVSALTLVNVFDTNLPRYFVEHYAGLVELGLFTTLGFILSAGTNFVVPVFFMTLADFGEHAFGDENSLKRARRIAEVNLVLSFLWGLCLVWIAATIPDRWMELMTGAYRPQDRLLLVVLACGAASNLLQSCLGFILTGLDIIKPQTICLLLKISIFVMLVATIGSGSVVDLAWSSFFASLAAAGIGLFLAFEKFRSGLRRSKALD